MRSLVLFFVGPPSLAMFLMGCSSGDPSNPTAGSKQSEHQVTAENNQEREVAFARLSPEDRPLAEAQGYCAVAGHPLGSMGPPLKLMIKGQPVFVCCSGCEKKAKASPDQTLDKVAELKSKVLAESSR